MKYNLLYALIGILFLLTSCGSPKNIIYFQDVENKYNPNNDLSFYESKIDVNDNLLITVTSTNPQAAEVFNTLTPDKGYVQNLQLMGYLVDTSGNINFPIVGKLHVAGLTKTEAIEMIQEKVSQYIDKPTVNIRFMNYKVSVLGEVNTPGTFPIDDERVTLPQAISMAGDLTIYGDRHNILVCRNMNGEKQFHRMDLTSPEVFSSPYYYLQQNDVIYVEPNGTKSASSTYNQNLPLLVSLISVVITAVALFLR